MKNVVFSYNEFVVNIIKYFGDFVDNRLRKLKMLILELGMIMLLCSCIYWYDMINLLWKFRCVKLVEECFNFIRGNAMYL